MDGSVTPSALRVAFYAAALIGAGLPAITIAQIADKQPSLPQPSTPSSGVTTNAAKPDQTFAVHVQGTFVAQHNFPFHAAFEGTNSLKSRGETRETADVTLYAGVRPWAGAELWVNPEIDQGFGLANTLGAAGFPSGEAYKVGKANPYFRLQRLFIRQTVSIGGARENVDPDLNQLGGHRTADRLVVTIGKIGVPDIFDTNSYAHDPRGDFLNWTIIDSGSFDYAADAWGYTYGGAVELYRGRFALRAGLFDLSKVPNSETLETGFGQYQIVAEGEARFDIRGRTGRARLTGFLSHGNMGRLDEAVARGAATGTVADTASVRRFASRAGASIDVEQALTESLGVFVRAGIADGRYEAFEFTDVDRTLSVGAALKGSGWGRSRDQLGIAGVVNEASGPRKRYLAAGGLGILIGDGALKRAGDEHIVETYYTVSPHRGVSLTADLQVIDHPAYNRDRGPVVVIGGRLHGQF